MIDNIISEVKEYFYKHIEEKGIEVDLLDVNVEIMKILNKYKEKSSNQGWISVKDRLPENESRILIALDDGFVATTDFIDGDFELWADAGEVIAWMPIPFADADKKIGGADAE